MRAVRATSDGVAVVDVPSPQAAGITDPVTVRPVSVGICGSDLHVIGLGPSGVTLGHEISAIYEGRPVAIQPMAFCGKCSACQRGDQHMCSVGGRRVHGIHIDGGMADELVVDAQCLVALPEGVSAEAASLVEPIAVGVHAVNKVDPVAGMRIAVIGAGTVGLVVAAVAQDRGVDQIDIVARHEAQFEAAERLGLRPVRADELGSGYDIVIDAAGSESSLAAAIGAVRSAGTVLVPGIYWSDVNLPGLALGLKEVQLRTALYWGHHDGRRETDIAAEVLGRLPGLPDALISHRFELGDAARAFTTAADRSAGAVKVIVDVSTG
ncbi:MAG: alcohol dehydrogenase catalytic domain-containing protein [Ilumatobacter sp.]|jgi:2-desacetyl-2-hydroxyethyl bacteriochlorophyllide A dehydrogenase|uniref:zinc-dependent alcohol dehydrogenase n=1 Tax=uncultured Ilumatobacter sp. TaxID=879968 RepID=UPI003590E78D